MPLVSSRRFVPPKGAVGSLADLSEIEVKDVDFIVLSGLYVATKGSTGVTRRSLRVTRSSCASTRSYSRGKIAFCV